MNRSEDTNAMIVVRDLVKRYKKSETNAVDGVSFTVERGEFFALLGPNGAGKTTTISILTTTLLPTAGTATIAGLDVVTDAARVRREVGIIFQQPSLDLNLTAEENVRFHAVLYKLFPFRPTFSAMPAAYKTRVHELATILGIEREIFKPVKRFSGGMKRKLEIIRSLIHDPKVLFLDEPTVGLDPTSRRGLWDYLRTVRRTLNTTVFLTTHYLDETEDADRVCIVNHGHVVALGTPTDVKAELVSEYLLVDASDRGRLRRELIAKGVAFEETPMFRIALDGQSVQQIIKTIDTPLSVVQTHTPTLEDAYLSIVGTGSDE